MIQSRKLIAEAWHFTKENPKLMWWYAFLPSLLTTLIGIFYLLYQFFSFKRSSLFDDAPESFLTEIIKKTISFMSDNGELWIPAILAAGIVLLFYLLLPTLCQGGLIQLIAKIKHGENMPTSYGISLGLLVFLPLFEYHLIIKSFSMISLFTEATFVLRNLGPGALQTLLPFFIIAILIGFMLTLLFTYSEFFIVLDKKPVLRSMGRSAKLVIMSWQHTFLIAILMLLIGVRVIINIIAVLLVPALLFFSAGLLATITLAKIGIVIGGILSIAGLLAASYFTGIFHVFASAVWTFTFLELMNESGVKEQMND